MELSVATILTTLQPTTFDAGAIFSGSPSGKTVKGYAAPGPFTPAVDPDYIFHEQSRHIVVWFTQTVGQAVGHAPDHESGQSPGRPENATADPLYVYGPTGCGKTSCIKQIAARLNFPVFEVTGHSRLEFPELVGHHVVRQGSMAFEYGPLALAMRYGGLFLCNEIDLQQNLTKSRKVQYTLRDLRFCGARHKNSKPFCRACRKQTARMPTKAF